MARTIESDPSLLYKWRRGRSIPSVANAKKLDMAWEALNGDLPEVPFVTMCEDLRARRSDVSEKPGLDRDHLGDEESNDVVKAILTRRSVRDRFERRPIPGEVLRAIIRCGLAAPSSKNARPWCLHVVSNPQVLAELAHLVAASEGADTYVPRDPTTGQPRPDWPSTVVESASVLQKAATGIFIENRGVFSDGRRALSGATQTNLEGSLVGYTFEVLGVGAAIENMFLAAHALGVQGTFMGDVVIAEEAISLRLGIKRDLIGVLALGYSSEPVSTQRVAYNLDDPDRVIWHGKME